MNNGHNHTGGRGADFPDKGKYTVFKNEGFRIFNGLSGLIKVIFYNQADLAAVHAAVDIDLVKRADNTGIHLFSQIL